MPIYYECIFNKNYYSDYGCYVCFKANKAVNFIIKKNKDVQVIFSGVVHDKGCELKKERIKFSKAFLTTLSRWPSNRFPLTSFFFLSAKIKKREIIIKNN